MRIECDQCGATSKADEDHKYCPKCGDSFSDEFRKYVKSEIQISAKIWAIALTVILLGAGIGAAIVYLQRTYTWSESITSPVIDKIRYTSTSYIHTENGNIPVTHFDYKLYLENGHVEDVSASEFETYHVGDSFTYTVSHRDWKPGMKDAPTPSWVYLVPIFAALILILSYIFTVIYRRNREVKEFEQDGDTEIRRD